MTTLTANLDNTASEIVTYQRDSTVQRKELAQKTKDFRKLDDASKLTEIKGLLKGSPDPVWPPAAAFSIHPVANISGSLSKFH